MYTASSPAISTVDSNHKAPSSKKKAKKVTFNLDPMLRGAVAFDNNELGFPTPICDTAAEAVPPPPGSPSLRPATPPPPPPVRVEVPADATLGGDSPVSPSPRPATPPLHPAAPPPPPPVRVEVPADATLGGPVSPSPRLATPPLGSPSLRPAAPPPPPPVRVEVPADATLGGDSPVSPSPRPAAPPVQKEAPTGPTLGGDPPPPSSLSPPIHDQAPVGSISSGKPIIQLGSSGPSPAAPPPNKPSAFSKCSSLVNRSVMPPWLIEALKCLEWFELGGVWDDALQALIDFERSLGFVSGVRE
jgi:hypothetical protein